MSRFPRIRRRPDHWASPHERAKARAAERLDGPLGLAESTWLDEHLAECAACAAIAAAYEADRQTLRSMRGADPQPPRDLWARTAAAIEQESAGRSGARRGTRDRRIPLGALSGIAVIAVVVGVSTMSSGLFLGSAAGPGNEAAQLPGGATASDATDTAGAGPETFRAEPTPLVVGAGKVRWVDLAADGSLALNAADIDQVCPSDHPSGCATLRDGDFLRLNLAAKPESIIATPDQGRAVVISRDADGSQEMVVVELPAVEDVTTTPSAAPTAEPAQSPAPTPESSDDASASPEPTAEASAAPTEAPETAEPSVEPTPDVTPSDDPLATPSPTPEASTAATLSIASDIQLIGETAAFSEDGQFFAFTARAADATTGSDVYLWKVGDPVAQPLTTDGSSTFASWDGSEIIVSRMGGDTSAGAPVAESLIVDPQTGAERSGVVGAWRPAVSPDGTRAVAWTGTLTTAEDGTVVPDEGRLELLPWASDANVPLASAQPLVEGPIGDFDARWDDTGEWLAVWTADPVDPTLGWLSLFRVDPTTGLIAHATGAPADVPALPGFSMGDGRLAWATPPGQGGEGSRLQIVAWNDADVGRVESAPGGDLVVIR